MKKKIYKAGGVITEADFNKVKMLIDLGLGNKQIEDIVGWKSKTISIIRNKKDYKEYKEYKRIEYQKDKNNKQLQPEQTEAKTTAQQEWLEALKENTKEIKQLREAIYVLRSDKKKGWF